MSSMHAYTSERIITGERIVVNGVVLVEGERVVAVGSGHELAIPAEAQRHDLGDAIICPGFVDIHAHGGDGADCTEGTPEAVLTTARRHLRAGTTSLLPTTATAPLECVWRAFDAIIAAHSLQQGDGARLLGIHAEGNWFAESQRGAHAPELLGPATPEVQERLLSYAPHLTRVTLAPELEGALGLIRSLAERGVLVSGGHSDALYAEVCRAMAVGLRHITHLWSGMSTVRRIGPKRFSGMLEAGLVEEGLTGEIIADGYHLPTSLMKMAYRLKGPEKLCLVSDAMQASGLGPGEYNIGGLSAVVEAGYDVAVLVDRTAFAGSVSTMGQCLQHVVRMVGISLLDAVRMATVTPARIINRHDIGRLAPGAYADLLALAPDSLAPRRVMLGGRWVN
ncbi:MAG: N-acetylglucosamine-6-phosphate deacetylase [Chloroflexi bacterium]|nr:N-acetylglucosamine-6-phosphate deacetylase [Chloroflexota bacterium]